MCLRSNLRSYILRFDLAIHIVLSYTHSVIEFGDLVEMDIQDSSHKVPLSMQIATAAIGNDQKRDKLKAEMMRDGFQTVWGVRKASEWVLEQKSEKKRKRYSRYLLSIWTQRAQGVLTDSSGQPTPLPKLRDQMNNANYRLREATHKLTNITSPIDTADRKGIVDCAESMSDYVCKLEHCIEQSAQIAAVRPSAPSQDSIYPVPFPHRPSAIGEGVNGFPQMAPIRPIAPGQFLGHMPPLPVTYKGLGVAGTVGISEPISPSALSHILQSLPPLKSQDPNVDFWIKLKDSVISFALDSSEVITIIKAKAPRGYVSPLTNAGWPRVVPDNDQAWEGYLYTCETTAQEILGRGYQSATSLSNCPQGSDESFSTWVTRFAEAHRNLACCIPETPRIESGFVIDMAINNLNETYTTVYRTGLPVLANWAEFLAWGNRAEAVIIRNEPRFDIAAVRDLSHVRCYNCDQMGHLARNCHKGPHKKSEGGQLSDDSELLTLLRSLAKSNLSE